MSRIFITGTDTDVGKTRVTAAVARAFVLAGAHPTIVKLVQTGVPAHEPSIFGSQHERTSTPEAIGDAERAGALAGCAHVEFARFPHPADPWAAARAAGERPPRATGLAERLDAFPEPLVIEGSGGAAVPLNENETISDVARLATCSALVVVGLRLGCISHSLLTIAYLHERAIPILGLALVDRWRATDYVLADVERALAPHATILGHVDYDGDERASVAVAARVFSSLT